MDYSQITEIVFSTIEDYCETNGVRIDGITKDTPLIGSNRILDSMGLVNIIVDIETAFLDEGVDVSLTSEAAMSGRISPFRSAGSLCHFIARQLEVDDK